MNRVGTAILLALALTARSAAAGDGAALNVLGFSEDGRYFAFEQYGEQASSGSLYAIITALEVATDRSIKGSPITAVMDPDDPKLGKEPRETQLGDVRGRAAAEAATLLKQLGISKAGAVMTSARRSRANQMLNAEDVKAARHAAVSSAVLPAEVFGPDARLVLRDFDIALPRCKDLVSGEHPSGFGLTLERKGRPTIHLHRDQTIPPARGCPDHYGIAEAHALHLPDSASALVVMIQYFYQGIEGPDRRFLAVTGKVVR